MFVEIASICWLILRSSSSIPTCPIRDEEEEKNGETILGTLELATVEELPIPGRTDEVSPMVMEFLYPA